MSEQIILHPVGEVVSHLAHIKAYLGTTDDEETLRFALAQTARQLPETSPSLPDPAQVWCDVAGMTGLLLPFVRLVWKQVERPRVQQEQRGQVREKLLENVGDPYQFFHVVSAYIRRLDRSVSLSRDDGTRFFYDQAVRLLHEAAIVTYEEEDLKDRQLSVCYDEVLAVFASLSRRYHTPGLYQTLVKALRTSLEPNLPLASSHDNPVVSTSAG